MTIQIVRVNGITENHTVHRGGAMAQIERLIGATVLDTVNLRDGRIMLVDDLGHQKARSLNPEATRLYWSVCRPGTTHEIVGDVAIARDEDFA